LSEKEICFQLLNLFIKNQPTPPAEPPPDKKGSQNQKQEPPAPTMSLKKSSLLPSTSQGFVSPAYWNAFFQKRTEGFEW
jgi:hypothetical protein